MLPVIRLFVACRSDAPGVQAFGHTLADIDFSVEPDPPDRYPLEFEEQFWFYAIVTGGRGRHGIQLRQRCGVGPTARLEWQSRQVTIDLGADPLAVHALPFRIEKLTFSTPGQYEFSLICNGVELDPPFYLEARV